MPRITPNFALHTLYYVHPGGRFWFGFAQNANGGQLIILSEQQADPDAERMLRHLRRLRDPSAPPSETFTGAATVAPDGAIVFSGHHPVPGFIPQLQRWVRKEQARYPVLRRLIGARYVQRGRGTRPLAEHRDDAGWQSVVGADTPLLVETHLNATAAMLRRAQPGERLVFWLSPQSVGGHPLLVLRHPHALATFQRAIKHLQVQGGQHPLEANGFLEINVDRRVQIHSFSEQDLLPTLAALVRARRATHPDLDRLIHAQQRWFNVDGEAQQVTETPALWETFRRRVNHKMSPTVAIQHAAAWLRATYASFAPTRSRRATTVIF